MTSTTVQWMCGAALTAVALMLAVPTAGASGSNGGVRYDDRDPAVLVGTWFVQVTGLADCVARAPLGRPFTSLLTFAEDGTLTGTTANPVFAAGQRTSDHGVWKQKRAGHLYRASTIALIAFDTPAALPASPGFETGSQTIVQTIQFTDPDHFRSDAVTEFFDADGTKYRSGCATAVAERWK